MKWSWFEVDEHGLVQLTQRWEMLENGNWVMLDVESTRDFDFDIASYEWDEDETTPL